MINQQGTDANAIRDLIRVLFEQHPFWSFIILLILAACVFGFIYLLLKERFSKRAKDIAEAGKLMAETLKLNTESLATAPQIVTSFTTLMESGIRRELSDLDQRISSAIDRQFTLKAKHLTDRAEEAQALLEDIRHMNDQVIAIKELTTTQLSSIDEQFKKIQSVLPDYDIWKSVADPELLLSNLQNAASWDEGKDLVGQIKKLVEDSVAHPEQIPSKYVESVGDWCRQRNQFPLALWFYEHAVERDPDRVSSKVELNALLAEYVPPEREKSLDELKRLALSGEGGIGVVKRIFNVLIEIDRFEDLVTLCSQLLELERFKNHLQGQCVFLRNRAVAKRKLALDHYTDDAWQDLKTAYELAPDDENTLKIYASWLAETGDYEDAVALCQKLLRLDHKDISYYLLLIKVYSRFRYHAKAHKVLEMATTVAGSQIDTFRLVNAKEELEKAEIRDDPAFLTGLNN